MVFYACQQEVLQTNLLICCELQPFLLLLQRGRVLPDEFEGMLYFELTSVIMMLTQAN